MKEFLDAPVPFIIGLDSFMWNSISANSELSTELVVFNIES
jgi:hypothetical protein